MKKPGLTGILALVMAFGILGSQSAEAQTLSLVWDYPNLVEQDIVRFEVWDGFTSEWVDAGIKPYPNTDESFYHPLVDDNRPYRFVRACNGGNLCGPHAELARPEAPMAPRILPTPTGSV